MSVPAQVPFPANSYNGNLKQLVYTKPFATNNASIGLLFNSEIRFNNLATEPTFTFKTDLETDALVLNRGTAEEDKNQLAFTYTEPRTNGTINGQFLPANVPSGLSATLAGITYTGEQLRSGLVRRNLTNPDTDFLPGATVLFPFDLLSEVHVGQYFDVSIHNYGLTAITLAPSADGTTTFATALISTIAAGTIQRYRIVASVVADELLVPLVNQDAAGTAIAAVAYSI
jgi:hypothetical protein